MSRVRTGAGTGTGRGRVGWPVGALLAIWPVCAALAACGTTIPPNAMHSCGVVHVAAGRIQSEDAAAASAAESCFVHYYASCQAAVLTYTNMGVDTSTTQYFSEHLSNGQCAVSDAAQGYTANGGGKMFPTQTYACTGMQQQADGLYFTNCGQEGNVLVPAPTAG